MLISHVMRRQASTYSRSFSRDTSRVSHACYWRFASSTLSTLFSHKLPTCDTFRSAYRLSWWLKCAWKTFSKYELTFPSVDFCRNSSTSARSSMVLKYQERWELSSALLLIDCNMDYLLDPCARSSNAPATAADLSSAPWQIAQQWSRPASIGFANTESPFKTD